MENNKFNNTKAKHKVNKTKKEAYVPVISEFAKELAATLQDQIEEYLSYQDVIGTLEMSEQKNIERSLFDFMSYPTYMETPQGIDEDWSTYKIYLLERHVRTDRETHKLIRGNCVVVVLQAGVPAFYANAFVSKDHKGSIVVTPMDQNGPRYRDTYRVQIGREEPTTAAAPAAE